MEDVSRYDLITGINSEPLDIRVVRLKTPFSQEIFLTNTQIAGLQYVRGIKKLAESLKTGDVLNLRRETENEHDDLATLVMTTDGKKVGYIPRTKNEVIARLMDAGKRMTAKVKHIKFSEDDDDSYFALSIYIDVFMIE